jgi:5-(carboxyamino)imidazole ribonucleotide mutase
LLYNILSEDILINAVQKNLSGGIIMPKVAIIMGSDADFPVLKGCYKLLKDFGIETEVMVCSAHRTPEKAVEFSKNAEKNGFEVIIAGAGRAAHLPGVLAAFTPLPIIGVPIKSPTLDGLDSLLSIVQMPAGVPVATVAVDGGDNAALLAVQILSVKYSDMRAKMIEYKKMLVKKIEERNEKLQTELKVL